MNPVKLLKTRFLYFLCVAILGIELFFLNPNRIMGIMALILSLILSFYCFTKSEKAEAVRKHRISSFSFFSCFLSSLSMEIPATKSYEIAAQFLTGYQEPVPYEEILENPDRISLYGYQDYFRKIIKMEEENEVHIADYLPLIDSLDAEIEKLVKTTADVEKTLKCSLGFLIAFFFLVLFLTIGNTIVSELLKNRLYSVYAGLFLPFAYPSVIFLSSKEGA